VPVPPRYSRVDPWVISSDAEAEIAFLGAAFDAQETPGSRMLVPDGRIGHVEVELGDAMIMLFDAQPEWRPTPAHLRVYVSDTQETFVRTVAAGARSVTHPTPSGSVWHEYAIHRATSGGYTKGRGCGGCRARPTFRRPIGTTSHGLCPAVLGERAETDKGKDQNLIGVRAPGLRVRAVGITPPLHPPQANGWVEG
jgi:uncharacterized glyoxalase superfamily protein PhnB